MKRIIFFILAAAVCICVILVRPRYVTYEKYGAVGDGIHDDWSAIVSAHDAANAKRLSVKAKAGAKYYIGPEAGIVEVRTDVDFGEAEFIIDDRQTPNYTKPIFKVVSVLEPVSLKVDGELHAGQQNLGTTLSGRSLVVIKQKGKKIYIRKGRNQNSGTDQKEVLLVGPDGTVEPQTAIVWDYEEVSEATAYPIDKDLLTIRGGIFTTIANADDETHAYYNRGIQIERSNVLVEAMQHHVTGEGEVGSPYRGFIVCQNCADVTVKDCTFSGHRIYKKIGNIGLEVSMGTYDLSFNTVADIHLERCNQFNDIDDTCFWGLMGTNFCKNFFMEDCEVSRFDAHMGVENVTLKNSIFGHMGVRMVGAGRIYLENCEMRYKSAVMLRQDYGSSWDGEIIIRNCTVRPQDSTLVDVNILNGTNSGDHDFGYLCCLPRLIDVDGLIIDDSAVTTEKYKGPHIYSGFGRNVDRKDLLPFPTDGKVILRNVTVTSGKPLGLSTNPKLFAGVEVDGVAEIAGN